MHLFASLSRSFLLLCLLPHDFVLSQSAEPANPNASSTARETLRVLQQLPSRGQILLGQDVGHGSDILDGYNELVVPLDRSLGLIGGDYQPWDGDAFAIDAVSQLWIEQAKRGAMITLSWHCPNPWTGGNSWDTTGSEDLGELIDPSTAVYSRWQAQKERIAAALGPLAGTVVVLWRPLHEMNGDWFWWGYKSGSNEHAAAYQALWRDLFDFLTYQHRMDHLLWVYGAAKTYERRLRNYYPGAGYVDVVGLSLYDSDVTTYDTARDAADLRSLGDHPLGLTEFGPNELDGSYDYRRLIRGMQQHWPGFSFAYTWHDWPGASIAYVSNRNAAQVLRRDDVATLDDIVQLRLDVTASTEDPPTVTVPMPVAAPVAAPAPTGSISGSTTNVRLQNRWRNNQYATLSSSDREAAIVLAPLNRNWYSQRWVMEEAQTTGVPQNAVRLRCRWNDRWYLTATSDAATAAPVVAWERNVNWWSMLWIVEQVGNSDDGFVRLRNAWSQHYLLVAESGELQTEGYQEYWWSMQWKIEPTG